MFPKSARFYDVIYGFKDYQQETHKLIGLIKQHKISDGNTLLDVACGTGAHLNHLQHSFEVQGLDLDDDLLAIARERLPGIPFHCADMVDFDLQQQFDIVLCLFSSIGYVKTIPRLRQSVASMVRHLKPGGMLIIEPWLQPAFFNTGTVHAHFVDDPDLKLARITRSYAENNVSTLEFHYLIGTSEGIDHFDERHEMGLFTDVQYQESMMAAGLSVSTDFPGLINRGLYIGVR